MAEGVQDQRAKTELKTEILEWPAVRFSFGVAEWFKQEDGVERFYGDC